MGLLKRIAPLALAASILSNYPAVYGQQDNFDEYERASVHMMMIKRLNNKYDELLEQLFLSTPFPERFNDHNLGVKVVSFAESAVDQVGNIESFIEQVDLGKKMVAKWFNRRKSDGSFDMELIKERGFYNASHSDIDLARRSLRGLSLLGDAGETLISNTYLIVNDISYKSKGNSLWFLKAAVGTYTGNVKKLQESLNDIGGFSVEVTSYLFRLKWDDEMAARFYNDCYNEDGDPAKNDNFQSLSNYFDMEYVGKSTVQSKEVNMKATNDPGKLLTRVMTRALDKNIAQLQHDFDFFRIKAPVIVDGDEIISYIGMKEDMTPDTRYEVLQRTIDEKTGRTGYKRVAIVRPVKGKICDNRYGADEEADTDGVKYSTFEKVSGGDIFSGLLLREL